LNAVSFPNILFEGVGKNSSKVENQIFFEWFQSNRYQVAWTLKGEEDIHSGKIKSTLIFNFTPEIFWAFFMFLLNGLGRQNHLPCSFKIIVFNQEIKDSKTLRNDSKTLKLDSWD
jgi:hypothetical protein